MRRAALPALMLAFALAGCTQSSDYWYRAANTPDQASSDERGCRDEATQVARQRSREDAAIYQDRTATSDSASVFRSDLNVSNYDRMASAERTNIRDLVRSCMADRGYRLRRD